MVIEHNRRSERQYPPSPRLTSCRQEDQIHLPRGSCWLINPFSWRDGSTQPLNHPDPGLNEASSTGIIPCNAKGRFRGTLRSWGRRTSKRLE
ncbi:hypothetical protein PILCRDRAFT_175936 [Piloderma croceum F 1598]|uniref:Uncharacterized protein n=1 Tax=Piloderma croceum (strain F 1598) TaxID=765440 RepID=A0A0C3BUM6_PILCF|nr:hypothetical protein PILCRDRAFT_175936 [Piloderma croceum F 1598]